MKLKYLWFLKKPEPRRFDIPEDSIEEILSAWDDYFKSRNELDSYRLYRLRSKVIPEADGVPVCVKWENGRPYFEEYVK